MVLVMVTCNSPVGSTPASVRYQNTVIVCFKGNACTFHLQGWPVEHSVNRPTTVEGGVCEGVCPTMISTAAQHEPEICSVSCGGSAYLLETVEVTLPSLFCFWLS